MHNLRCRLAGFLVALVAGALAAGCVFGPTALQVSRSRYGDAIRTTTSEQLLMNLVLLKYRESPVFLDVGNVAAQFKFVEDGGISGLINEGPNPINPDVLGLSANVRYEETPTITFSPLQGKDFVNRMLSPLSPEVLAMLSRSGWRIDRIFRVTIQQMNGLDNASGASGPTPEVAPEFKSFLRACELFRELQRRSLLIAANEQRWTPVAEPLPFAAVSAEDQIDAAEKGLRFRPVKDSDRLVLSKPIQALVWHIPDSTKADPVLAAHVTELVKLLGLVPGQSSYDIVLGADLEHGPAAEFMGDLPKAGTRTEIRIATRSLMGALYYLSQAVETPLGHVKRGLVTNTRDAEDNAFDWRELTGDLMEVRVSQTPPRNAAVVVRRGRFWYYIDDSDLSSKSTFSLLSQLFALQAGGAETAGPVLTLPVGG